MRSKKELELILSRLKDLEERRVSLEQYSTPSSIASSLLWLAYERGDIASKVVADLGTGNGILAIGAALLGAKEVYAVEIDGKALEIARENYENLKRLGLEISKVNFIPSKVEEFAIPVDVVVMNPPFGIKRKGYDKVFLAKAFSIAPKVYSIHKLESKEFYEKFSSKFGFSSKLLAEFDFRLKATFKFHKKRFYAFRAGFWYFEKVSP